MFWSNRDYQGPHRYDRKSGIPEDAANSLLNVGMVFAVCVFLASFLPLPLALLALENLLSWAAIGFAFKAMVAGEGWSRDRLTGWDQALMMTAASITAGLFVDPTAFTTADMAASEHMPT